MSESPAQLGYRMPAEWEEHDATWLSWPKDPGTFPPTILPQVEETYVKIVSSLSAGTMTGWSGGLEVFSSEPTEWSFIA
jgi:agmatine/peptidylarginine deiminase